MVVPPRIRDDLRHDMDTDVEKDAGAQLFPAGTQTGTVANLVETMVR